jgi:hypothetical protein
MDRGGEATEDQATGRLLEDLLQRRDDGALRGRSTAPLHIRRIGQEREHAPVTILAQSREIGRLADDRLLVELHVGQMHADPHRRPNGQGHTVNRRMRGPDELDLKRPGLDEIPRLDDMQLGLAQQPMLDQLVLRHGQREARAINRHVDDLQQIGQRADVIFVSMREDERAHARGVRLDEPEVGDDDVHPMQALVGEHQTCINEENVLLSAQGQHVHPEFP